MIKFNLMKHCTILFVLVITPSSYAAQHIAVAKIVKGNVSYLPIGARNARKLKKGTKLYKDTSIYVNGKGFAKIRYINSSSLVVGPNSKVSLEMDLSDKTSLVNLVSGKIRAAVDKNPKNDKKFLVKTSSATMGVRGTEFQVSFAPKAKKTSLLTFEGQVDMKKSKAITQTVSASNQVSQIKESLLEDPTPVKKGDFLRIAKTDDKDAKKVKINPKQFVLMKKDKSLGANKVVLSRKEKSEISKEVKKLEKDFAKDLEGKDSEAQSFGYVDFDKGVYIPPLDTEKGKFLGNVGNDGSYIPPKGVEVDENKGIVLKAKTSKEIKEFIDKVNKDNQVPKKILNINQKAYQRYFDV